MRIAKAKLTDTGMHITHDDGSTVEYCAEDAFKLQRWIRIPQHYQALFEAMRRAEKKEKQSRKES
jgi:hypothetical protein